MKNTIRTNKRTFFTNCIICIAMSVCLLFVLPSKSFAYQTAKAYTWKTTINASINTDGSISVSETKIIDITKFVNKAKSFKLAYQYDNSKAPVLNPAVWDMYPFPEQSNVELGNAKIAILSNEDTVIGNWINADTAQFLAKWHKESGPDKNTYSYDSENKQMCLFVDVLSRDTYNEAKCCEILEQYTGTKDPATFNFTKAIINLNYTIKGAVDIYKDVADFKWNYVTSTWDMDSYNVDLQVSVPVGKASINSPLGKVSNIEQQYGVATERNIYAWGHGSSSGIVDLNPNGIISLNNKVVPGGSNAEIRIVFPSAWLINLDLSSNITQQNQAKLTSILKDESVWKDNRTDNVNKMNLTICYILMCLIILIALLIIKVIYSKRFSNNIISKSKIKQMHPCVLARLKNWNHSFPHDIIISLLKLHEQKRIEFKRMKSSDYEIILKAEKDSKSPYASKNINIIEKRTINFLFNQIACGGSLLKLNDIYNYANARPYEFMSGYLSWHSLLTDEINKFAQFKSNYDLLRHILFGISIGLSIISIIFGIIAFDALIVITGLFTSLIIAYNANSMRNKLYFKDENNKAWDVSVLPVNIGSYTENVDNFRKTAISTLKKSVLLAQDNISKFNLDKSL